MENLISIIVPVYNCEKYLSQCIDSILGQTHRDFELILVDDGSVDRSGAICDAYAKCDERIRVIHKENGGVSSARNAGLDVAQGGYITFADSDDFVSSNHLRKMYQTMGTDASIVMCRFAYYENETVRNSEEELPVEVNLDKKLSEYIPFVSRFLNPKNNIFGGIWRMLWRRDAIGDIRFNCGIRICEDLLFILQTFDNARILKSTTNVGYFYRVNIASATKSYKKNFLNNQLNLHRELMTLFAAYDCIHSVLQLHDALLSYSVFSNEIKYRPDGWHRNIRAARKSELYPYFKLKYGLKLHGKKPKIKFLIVWFLVKTRLV